VVQFYFALFSGLFALISEYQNRERTGIPARAARMGWWMRPAEYSTFATILGLNPWPVATAPGSDMDTRIRLLLLAQKSFEPLFYFLSIN
jgi:hypothetical protein